MAEPITVLVVDDSALMRTMITHMLSTEKNIKVVGWAEDGLSAIQQVKTLRPDVVTLDIEMPELDGVAALRAIMHEAPTRVVMLSGDTRPGLAYKALRLGAVDFVGKPSGTVSYDLKQITSELIQKINAAAYADLRNLKAMREVSATAFSQVERTANVFAKVVAIGSSTGGPRALEQIFRRLAPGFPAAILVVQHLPVGYSQALAERLTDVGQVPVKEAADGDPIRTGQALLAPGDRHMVVTGGPKGGHVVKLEMGPPVHRVRPAVDKLMLSVAEAYGKRSVGVILSGMGVDGVAGLGAIKRAGGRTVVQDEATSVVFGMPGAAVEHGLADRVSPIDEVAQAVLESLVKTEKKYEEISLS